MTRHPDAKQRERAPAQRPRVDAERERVNILERQLEEAQERAAQRAEFERHLDCALRFAR